MHPSNLPAAVAARNALNRKMDYYHDPVVCVLSDRTVKFDAVRLMLGTMSAFFNSIAPGTPCPAQNARRSPAKRAKHRARTGRR